MIDDVARAASPRLFLDDVSDLEAPAFALPTGTVSFLLTDIEGSSRHWEHASASMAVAVPRHYELLDEAIARWGGVRPVEQGEGDSVVAAFARASDAVAAALDAQRALHAEAWPDGAELRVRMAIHTGEAQLRDEGNYFGQTVIRCARLRGIGHGGQVLVSDATASLVVDRLPEGTGLADLGTHRLRDLGRPERVWQLVHPDLPSAHPALHSLDAHRHNLPVQLTPLIGRTDDIDALSRLVGEERLITLSGSGGVGKTRLALAVAAEVIEQFPGGVWLVELAGVADRGGVGAAVLNAVGAHQVPSIGLVEQLVAALSDSPSLLLLDNCEHLLEECAVLVAAVLAQHPSATVLATAREPLGVPGEVTWRVRSLAAPPPETVLAVPSVSQYEAVRLFVDRARRARPSFTVSDANAPAIAQICYRLDGIPLALELAAARCRQLPVERIALDLDDRFHLLTGGARTVLPRQQTLAASIDWSYDRLDEVEQLVFRRLAVFVNLFALEGAEAVASALGDVDRVAVFDVLSRLVDKSIVVVEERLAGESCYRLLETLRAYGLDRARAAGELPALRDAHLRFWMDWLESREDELHTDRVVEHVELFHDSLAAALEWSARDPEVGLTLLRWLARPWHGTGRPHAAMTAVDQLLTDANAEQFPAAWAAAAATASILVGTARSAPEARALVQRGRSVAEATEDEYLLTLNDFLLGMTEENSERLRHLARERGARYVECIAIVSHASVTVEADPHAAAASLNEPTLLSAARESRYLADLADRTAARAALALGDLARCVELGLRLATSPSTLIVGNAARLVSAAALLGEDEETANSATAIADQRLRTLAGTQGAADLASHRRALLAGGAVRIDPELLPENLDPHDPLAASSLFLLCREAIDAGAGTLAVETARLQARESPPGRAVLATIEAAATLDEDRWHEALTIAVGNGLRLVAVDALEGLAVSAAASEAWAECLRLASAALRLRDETGYRWRFRSEQQRLDVAVTAATQALGPEAAIAAKTEGADLSWTDAAAYAARARGTRNRPSHGWAALTPTEQQVVALVADGLTNPQIAERLLMGRATVKTHIDHVFAKTGLRSRTEVAAEYVRRGLTAPR